MRGFSRELAAGGRGAPQTTGPIAEPLAGDSGSAAVATNLEDKRCVTSLTIP
jgi:hypothetical protein